MKVVFLANLPSPYRSLFFAELGKYCDLTVIFERESASDRNEKWKADTDDTYRAVFLKGKKIGTDNSICPEIIHYLKDEKFDKYIVGMYSTFTAMLAIEYLRFHKIPFYLSTDGGFIQEDSSIKYHIKKHFISSATWWLCPSDRAIDYFVHYGARREKTYKYPFTSLLQKDIDNALMPTRKEKQLLRAKLNMIEEHIVLSVGRFSYMGGYGKGYDTLLSAAEKLEEDVGIYIVGDDPTEEFLKWKEEKRLEHVHFIGFKEKNELAEYYAAADVFILLTRKDNWGLVINEAMSFSLPIITTKQCLAGLELVHPGENGYLIEAGDVIETVSAIRDCLMDEKRCEKMGNESRKLIEDYSIENMAYTHIIHMGKS